MTMIGFTDAIRRGFQQYAVFSGRASRAEYWWWSLMVVLLELIIGASDPLWTLATLVLLVPTLAVSVRRLHDTGRSGWTLLLFFIPLVGWIILIVFLVGASETIANRYGPPPTFASRAGGGGMRGMRGMGLRDLPRPDWSGGDPGPTGWRDDGPTAPGGGSGWDGPPPPPPRP